MTIRAPEYRFVSEWRVLGTVEEVAAILEDAGELPRWWPSVYLDLEPLAAGGDDGVGRQVRVRTKGWLPYTLDWEFEITESRHPFGFSIEARGDLVGRGVWTLDQAGAWTLVRYDWRVRAEKPLLRLLTPLIRPVLASNHGWAMRRGERSLALELARRRAATATERARIPPPPAPVPAGPLLVIGSTAAAVAAFALARLLSRRRR